jgi:hypothetical protein
MRYSPLKVCSAAEAGIAAATASAQSIPRIAISANALCCEGLPGCPPCRASNRPNPAKLWTAAGLDGHAECHYGNPTFSSWPPDLLARRFSGATPSFGPAL